MNARLVYHGRRITQPVYLRLVERAIIREDEDRKHYVSYVVRSGRAGELIDANPRYPGSSQWFGGRVNEPSVGETANMLIVVERKPITRPVFVTVRTIGANEELLVHYGRPYQRTYAVGQTARRPSWL